MIYLKIFIVCLPIIIFSVYIYYKDKTKESIKLLSLLLLGGILCGLLALVFNDLLKETFLFNRLHQFNPSINTLIFYNIIVVGMKEEFLKFLILFIIAFANSEFDEFYDSIVYSCFVSLGFACLENIIYVYNHNLVFSDLILRSITGSLMHLCCAVVMAYFFSKMKLFFENKKYIDVLINVLLALILPGLIHGIYDLLLDLSLYFNLISSLLISLEFVILSQVVLAIYNKYHKINRFDDIIN